MEKGYNSASMPRKKWPCKEAQVHTSNGQYLQPTYKLINCLETMRVEEYKMNNFVRKEIVIDKR
jgi:hypothetical protein